MGHDCDDGGGKVGTSAVVLEVKGTEEGFTPITATSGAHQSVKGTTSVR